MTDEIQMPSTTQPMPAPAAATVPPVSDGALGSEAAYVVPQSAPDRPELIVGAAFATGFAIALILKRLGH